LKLRQIVTYACVFLCLDAVCWLTPALRTGAVSYLFQILAPIVALLACTWRERVVAHRWKRLWILLSSGVVFWICGILLAAWEDLFQHVPFETPFISDFVYFFAGVPMLFALSTPGDGQRFGLFSWLDWIQAAFAGYLTYITIFSVLPFSSQPMHPISLPVLVLTYNVENTVLAAGSALRLLASPRGSEERNFFGTMLIFEIVYGAGTAVYNHHGMKLAGHDPADMFSTVPFILLACMALALPRPRVGEVPARRRPAEMFIDHASPVFFTLALLTLGLIVLRTYFVTGIVAIGVALAVYGVRTTVLQTRYLQTQYALQEARDRLEAISLQDGLTGIANRRSFDQALRQEWHRAARNGQPLALLLIDLDAFKNLNDTRGHRAGDRALTDVAGALRAVAARSGDLVARYGGEEFAVILPDTPLEAALAMAERMRAAVRALQIANETPLGPWVTASVGVAVAEMTAADISIADAAERLIDAADLALYKAKQWGRNRVEQSVLQNADESMSG
jgi:diguanylate cyclase (GGDEF)-like protein